MKPKAKHNIKASVPTKLLSLLLIFSMLLAAVPAMVSADEQAEGEIITRTFEFSLPATQSTDHGFIELQVEGAEGTNIQSGSPQLPEHIEKIILPYGAHDIQVEFTTTGEQTITLEDPVVPGPISKTRRDWNYPVISTILRLYDARYNEEVQKEQEITQRVNEVIYNSEESYPDEGHFSSQIGVEINNEGERVTSVIARIHPAVFENVAQGKLSCITGGSIQVSYTPPSQTLALDETYELLILSPSAYLSALQPLVQHKEDMGFITKLVCLDDIYAETYFELTEDEREQFNHDDQETIKYFIYNAIKEWDIEYVLAVGGWRTLLGFNVPSMQFPIRYSHNVDGEPGYVTEQYYSCCIAYEAGNYVFDTWDSNGNGRFAEWDFNGKDTYDPGIDVHWGRLACRNVKEVRTMVDKIITYETTAFGSHWFNRFVCVGGDSAPGDTYYEGEEENKQAIKYMDGFEPITVWTSDETFTGPEDVINAISQGCGFLFFDGHANPGGWSTHPPNDESIWINGLQNSEMSQLENGEMLPICVVGGCHCGQFDVHPFNIIRDIVEYGIKGYFFEAPFKFYHSEWVPKCWSWKLTSVENGGSIATIAFAGLDWFAVGDDNDDGIPDCTQFFSGFINVNFFKNYGVNGITTLGDTYTQTINDYIEELPPFEYYLDCKTIEELTLMGDPTLLIGGYEE